MQKPPITSQIYNKALTILENNPEGIHWSELLKMIQTSFPTFHPKTINGCIWKLIDKYSNEVYKPERGVFRLLKYKK